MRTSLLRLITVLIVTVALIPLSAQAQSDQRCFSETSFCISGRIREFWEKNGGLPVFGFPIGAQQLQTIEGKSVQAQNFERNRLELHPENARPYDVLLGRLGADRLSQIGKDWQTYPKSGPQPGCRFFTETGQNVCGTILRAWRASGLEIDNKSGKSEAENLALFGLPLSPLVTEKQADGQDRQIQWFERARFEIHPENQAPYDVLLGLLGNELRDGATASAPTPPVDQKPRIPASVNAVVDPESGPRGTVFYVMAGGFMGGEQIGVYITGPDQSVYGAPFQVKADNDGLSEVVTLTTKSFRDNEVGIWAMTFEGVESHHKGIAYFEVTK